MPYYHSQMCNKLKTDICEYTDAYDITKRPQKYSGLAVRGTNITATTQPYKWYYILLLISEFVCMYVYMYVCMGAYFVVLSQTCPGEHE
jgi:hypothetical protein